jgi:hypothetical protein
VVEEGIYSTTSALQNGKDSAVTTATGRFNRLDPFFGNLQDPQSLHKYVYGHGDPVAATDPTGMFGSFSVGGMLGALAIGAIVGVGAFTVARFGFGYSTGESIAIGVLFGLSSFYLAAAMPLAAAVGGVLGEVIGFWFAIRGALLLAASVIELIANRASAYYNPAKAATLNNQWLTAFEAKYAAHPDPPKVALARSALSHLLTTASNTETRYDGIMTVLSMFGAAKPQSPCLAWAESVWKRQREYLQAHDAERLALQDLGIDITMIQWKSHVAAAHYTVEISLSPAAGAERWEIDNGWAFTEIDDLDAYAIGVPFARSGWDPDSKKFIMHEPPGRPGEILLP